MSNSFFIKEKIVAIEIDGAALVGASTTIFTTGGDASIDFDVNGNGWFGVFGYEYLRGIVRSDQDGDFYVQYSHDGATIDDVAIPNYQTVFNLNSVTDATDGVTSFYTCGFESKIIGPYARVVFINGAAPATNFNLVVFMAVEEAK